MQECIYEAQLSLILFGVDDFFWTAYFCGDTYFTGKPTTETYLENRVDAPSGGQRTVDWPIWDPRYYFLYVLSIRISQITREWTVLVQTLENYLDPLVSHSRSVHLKSWDMP